MKNKETAYENTILRKEISSVESERDRYKELRDDKDDQIHNLNKDLIYLKTTKEEETDSKNSLKKELQYYKEKYEDL